MSNSGGLEIYLEHFGLVEKPFSLLPDPDFLFWSPAHKRAYTMLEYGLYTRAPITLVTGEIGAGKTTLLQHLLRKMTDDVTIGLVSNAQGGRGELLRWVMMALSQDVKGETDYVELFVSFQDFLIEEYAEGRSVVLIFDEAQNLDREALEELRMYTNINSNKYELLQMILVGQPELRDMVRQPSLVQFSQRVGANVHLPAMDTDTVMSYIQHRMRTAGAKRDIFTEEAMQMIGRAARGVPRIVNQIADFSLVYAFSDNSDVVDKPIVQEVLREGLIMGSTLILENPVP